MSDLWGPTVLVHKEGIKGDVLSPMSSLGIKRTTIDVHCRPCPTCGQSGPFKGKQEGFWILFRPLKKHSKMCALSMAVLIHCQDKDVLKGARFGGSYYDPEICRARFFELLATHLTEGRSE